MRPHDCDLSRAKADRISIIREVRWIQDDGRDKTKTWLSSLGPIPKKENKRVCNVQIFSLTHKPFKVDTQSRQIQRQYCHSKNSIPSSCTGNFLYVPPLTSFTLISNQKKAYENEVAQVEGREMLIDVYVFVSFISSRFLFSFSFFDSLSFPFYETISFRFLWKRKKSQRTRNRKKLQKKETK